MKRKSLDESPKVELKGALICLLPRDYQSALVATGVIAGLAYYMGTHDTWLLVTFLSILFGRAIEQVKRGAMK